MYMLLNLLGTGSCFCIIHTCISWSADHAHEVIKLKGACNSLDTEIKTCMSKGLAFDSFYVAHGQMSTKSIVYSIKLIPMK